MIYLDNPSTDPAYNLALEEHLVYADERDILMLWQNDPAVIVGRNQHTDNQVDRALAAELGIAVVRRLSGGGAVYHDRGNLNFTLILRDATRYKQDFAFFTRPIVEVLRSYGVDAVLHGRNDLLAGGRKFSGNAQYYHGSTVMHHGTILWDSDLDVLARVLKPKQRVEARGVDSHTARVTNLAPLLAGAVTLERFKADLVEALVGAGDVGDSCSNFALTSTGEMLADSKMAFTRRQPAPTVPAALLAKYRSDAWNWGEGVDDELAAPFESFPASC